MGTKGFIRLNQGFKFSPTEEELIVYYLKRKIEGLQKWVDVIREIDIIRHEPWDLPGKSIIPSNNEWYFFSPRGRKYPKGRQSRRATQFGYWKATGKERDVKSGTRVVGAKRTLVFYKGRAPNGKRTEWIMHEYGMSGTPQESFVVCRVRNRRNYEFKCSDIPENTENNVEHMEMFQGLTALDQCNNPHLVDRFDSEYDKKPGNIIFQHLVESFDSESEYKKPGNLFLQDEYWSSPKFRGEGGVTDMLNEDIMMLDESSFPNLVGNDILNDDFMDFKFEQPTESFPTATLATPTSEEAPAIIKIRTRRRDKPIKPLPFQGTAPRRIRMQKWQDIDEPSVEASCMRDEMHHIVTVNHRRVILLVVLSLGLVFLAALFAGILHRQTSTNT